MVDSIPPDEFIRVFHRLCGYVRLGRVRNPQDIKKRIKRILTMMKHAYKNAKRSRTIRKFKSDYMHLRILYRHGIHRRIWNEAVENPGGLIELTLTFGYDKANRMVLEREKRRKGKLRRVR